MMQISTTELKARLVSFAREIGFDSCRVAACNAPAHAIDFREWLRDGAHGEMNYMQRGEEKRCDPQSILPGARSIVVLALNYFQGKTPHRGVATGKIARYAWGEDYHDVIANKLCKVNEFLRSFGGQQKCYAGPGSMRNMRPLHNSLSNRRDYRCASVGRAPVHFLPNDRIENSHPCGASSAHGRSDLWLR